MQLYLVRHGQSEANAGWTDFLDSPLTPLGRAQATRTAERLAGAGLTRLYVSPLRRTLETIAPISEAADRRTELLAAACEYFSPHHPGFLTFEGLAPEAIAREFPFAFVGETFPCPAVWWPRDFEDEHAVYARASQVRDTLLGLYAATEERLLIVSHSDTVGRLIEAFLRVAPRPRDPEWTDNCGVALLECPSDRDAPATLMYRNDTSHLRGLDD